MATLRRAAITERQPIQEDVLKTMRRRHLFKIQLDDCPFFSSIGRDALCGPIRALQLFARIKAKFESEKEPRKGVRASKSYIHTKLF
ncbi:hypothetical protein OnM2_061061 [Erysiphe neolycopersici]|uniref:Uncharacterized protein n=1 Tax=Erysiphe neolycopersici TaxID=212602 RepID=A0A420HPM1_9PEZI|nr:hypothetical protein OnM2_061061 [Erysiphe neolycopersici]